MELYHVTNKKYKHQTSFIHYINITTSTNGPFSFFFLLWMMHILKNSTHRLVCTAFIHISISKKKTTVYVDFPYTLRCQFIICSIDVPDYTPTQCVIEPPPTSSLFLTLLLQTELRVKSQTLTVILFQLVCKGTPGFLSYRVLRRSCSGK